MILPLKLLGYFGPYILNVLSLFLFLTNNKISSFIWYFLGIIISLSINFIVKIIVKNPRPKEDKSLFDSKTNINKTRVSFDKYGFPSGHSQSCAYSTLMTYMVFRNTMLFYFYLFISLFTSYQRVDNKNHTITQVIGGLVIGSVIGYLIFVLSKKYPFFSAKQQKQINNHNSEELKPNAFI